MHEVAFVEDQVRTISSPACTNEVGDAERVTVGAGTTVTVAFFVTEPPVPVQVTPYAVVESGFTVSVPEVAPPVEKPDPLPVQEVVFAELQVRVDAPPEPTEVGDAERDAVGAGAAFTVMTCVSLAVPPEPVQDRVYVVVVEGDAVTEPETAPPVAKPVPVQDVAFVEDQVRVVELPFVMVVGEPERVAVGGWPLSVSVSVMVFVPTEANVFGDLEDPESIISQYIASHRDVRVRKPEKGTQPKHFYTGGGDRALEPLAAKREEGMSLFDRIGTLDHVGGK